MEIGKALQFFRRNNQFTQKELTSEKFDISAYSRIENDKQAVRLDILEDVLDQLSISTDEFFLRASFNDNQQKFHSLYNYCATHLNDRKKKKELVNYYQKLVHKQKKLRELSNYISITNYFYQYWEEVKPLNRAEIEGIYEFIINRKYYQQFDYTIISNMIFLFDTKRQVTIVEQALPLAEEEKRDETTKKFAYTIFINVISSQIYRKNLLLANKYLELAKQSSVKNLDYKYRLHIQYLDDLLHYLETGNYRYLEQIHYFIHLLENLGDTLLAENIENEVKRVVHQKFDFSNTDSYPVGLLR